jgi:hypothetical protein
LIGLYLREIAMTALHHFNRLITVSAAVLWAASPAAANTLACEKIATEKKLTGAAFQASVVACTKANSGPGSAQQRCEKAATDKKLAGAAKTSNIRKCLDAALVKP